MEELEDMNRASQQTRSKDNEESRKNIVAGGVIVLAFLVAITLCCSSTGLWGLVKDDQEVAQDQIGAEAPSPTTAARTAATASTNSPSPEPTRIAIDLRCPEPELSIGETTYKIAFRVYVAPGSIEIAENGSTCDHMAGCDIVVLDGPVCINGFNWYLVRDEYDRMEGWMAAWDEGGGWDCIDAPARDSLARTYGDFSVLMYEPFTELAPGFVEAGCNTPDGCEVVLGPSICHYGTLWTIVSLPDDNSVSGRLPAGAYYLLEE